MYYAITFGAGFIGGIVICSIYKNAAIAVLEKELSAFKAAAQRQINKL